jgi:hypothetical protein
MFGAPHGLVRANFGLSVRAAGLISGGKLWCGLHFGTLLRAARELSKIISLIKALYAFGKADAKRIG